MTDTNSELAPKDTTKGIDLMTCRECGKLCGSDRHTYVHCLEYMWNGGRGCLTDEQMHELIDYAHVGTDYNLRNRGVR